MNKADDRTAFPIVADSLTYICDPGMTLRDYFAAKAMQIHGTALSDMAVTSEEAWDELVSKRAYKTADAMLKAREE